MRYWVYDEEGILFRRFYSKADAEKFLQPGWQLKIKPKQKKQLPTTELYGEARW